MKNFIELIKKYKLYLLASLFVIFFFRSCIKSSEARKLDKVKTENVKVIDSLNNVILSQKDTINNISDVIREEKLKVHRYYDNYISEKDRDNQLMELHRVVKNNIKDLEKK